MRPAAVLRSLRPLLFGSQLLAAGLVAAEQANPQNFTLFMGVDLDVQVGKETHRVKNVAGDSFIVVIGGKPVTVSMSRGPVGVKVVPQLKLSDKAAVVNDLKFERDYTPQNDPRKKWAAFLSAGAASTEMGSAARQMTGAMSSYDRYESRMQTGSNPGEPPVAREELSGRVSSTSQAFSQAGFNAGSDQSNSAYAAGRMQAELDKELFDAIRVTCKISASQPLRDPYLVIVTQYREKGDTSGAVKNWIFAQAVDRLDERPVEVSIMKGGFPPGFEVLKQQLHIYGAGREVGSNVAEKNISLTRDDAHQYMVLDYLASHKTETLGASLVLGVTTKDLYPHYGSEQVQREIYVKVDKDGLPQGAFHDQGCKQPAGDEYLDGLVAQVRFKPALKAGKATDGVAKLKIASLVL